MQEAIGSFDRHKNWKKSVKQPFFVSQDPSNPCPSGSYTLVHSRIAWDSTDSQANRGTLPLEASTSQPSTTNQQKSTGKQKETARPLLRIVTEQSELELPEFEEEESLLDIEPLSPLPSNFDTPPMCDNGDWWDPVLSKRCGAHFLKASHGMDDMVDISTQWYANFAFKCLECVYWQLHF